MAQRLIADRDMVRSGANLVADGAKGDAVFGTAGAVAAGSNAFTQTDGVVFTAADNGKTIIINGAGANGASLTTTIAVGSGSGATLADAATCAVPASYLSSSSLATAGTGVVPGDTFDFTAGTAAINARLTVSTTKVASATVAAGGSGGTAGTQTVFGTTGTGKRFAASVTVAGGAITAVLSILIAGAYSVNPTALTTEPVVGAGLTGAQLNVVMGANAMSVTRAGNYSVVPTNPVTASATSGASSGVTFTFTFTTSGAWVYASDDTAKITAAVSPVYLPPGKVYFTTLSESAMAKQTYGAGVMLDSNRSKKSPLYSKISSAPSSFGTWGAPGTAFTGDLSAVRFPIQHYITGAATLGQPTTGYRYTEEAYPFLGFLYNSSGWNQSTSSNAGRTAAAFARVRVTNAGQGDCVAYNATGFVSGAKASATSFLANPAVSIFNGGVSAGSDGVYLNPVEIQLDDAGYDVAGIAFVSNMTRSKSIGGLSAYWAGIRIQSNGAEPIDVVFSGQGPARFGMDLSFLTLDSNAAAITLKADQKIYWNVTASDASGLSRYPSSVSTTATWFSSSNVGFQMTVNNTNIYLLTVATAFLYPLTTVMGQGQNNRLSFTTGANGVTPAIAVTGTSDTNVDLGLTTKGSGLLKFVTAANMAANGSVATALSSIGPTGSHTTVQEWLQVKNSSGTVRYIPCF